MATHGETRNQTSSMPGRKPSFSRSIGQSLSAAFGKKDGYYFEVEFLSDTPSHHVGEKKQILVDYMEIGRSSSCAIRYKGEGIEAKVSGKHVSITRNGGEWTLEHLSKTNSTIINGGGRIIRSDDGFKRYVLKSGDTVQLAKGGPTIRFIVPVENSMQGLRSKSRGTTFVRNIISQALAPQKTKIRWLASALVVVAVGFATFSVFSINKMSDQAKIIDGLRRQLDDIGPIPDSVFVVQRDTVVVNNTRTIVRENRASNQEDRTLMNLAQRQNIKYDVYKLFFDSIVLIGPDMHIKLPFNGGSGSGFLLSDGKFVTARHCVEWWVYPTSDLIGPNNCNLPYLAAASMYDFFKLTSYFHAVSPSGNVFYFSSDQFSCDHSEDSKYPILDEQGNPQYAEDGTPFFIYVASGTKLGLDWAYTNSTQGKRGVIEADIDLSESLQIGQKLLIVGYPLGYSGDSNEPISNDQPYILDPPYSHGCFVYSSGSDHGNSGGPIFANKDGRLVAVGLVSQGGSSHNLAVPMKNLR